jgi:hypothetical protein
MIKDSLTLQTLVQPRKTGRNKKTINLSDAILMLAESGSVKIKSYLYDQNRFVNPFAPINW